MKRKIATLVIGLLKISSLFSQSVDLKLWSTDGKVNSIGIDSANHTLYLGGQFAYIGPTNPGLSLFDTNFVEQGLTIPDLSSVFKVIPYGTGWIIGGAFQTFNGATTVNLVHVDSVGNIIFDMPTVSSSVFALQISGDTLFIGGDFTTVNGQSRSKLAAWKLSTNTLLGLNFSISDRVNDIIVNGNKILIGGRFTSVSSNSRNRLAELNRNVNTVTSWNPNANDEISKIYKDGDTLYVHGTFTTLGGQSRYRVGSVSLLTGNVLSWNPIINNYINALFISDTAIILGGGFTLVNSISQTYLAAVKKSDGSLISWGPSINGFVQSIVELNNKLVLSGGFTLLNGQSKKFAGAINKNNSATIANINLHTSGSTCARNFCRNGDKIIAYGLHISIGGDFCNNFTALDLNTGKRKTNFNVPINSFVNDILIDNNKIYLGGAFTTVNSVFRGNTAAIDTSGNLLAWNPNVFGSSGSVIALEKYGDTIFIAGYFSQIGGISRANIGAVNSTTGSLLPWNPTANYSTNSLEIYNGKLYVAGSFTQIAGQPRGKMSAFSLPSLAITSFNPSPQSTTIGDNIFTTYIKNNKLYVGGNFITIGGLTRYKLAEVDLLNSTITTWNPNGSNSSANTVNGICVDQDFAYVVGQATFGSGYHGTFQLLNEPVTFNPTFSYSTSPYNIIRVDLCNDYLYVAGEFNQLFTDKRYFKNNIVRFCLGPPAPQSFTAFIDSVCENSGTYNYSVSAIDSAEYYVWNYSGTNVIINDSLNFATLTFLPGATTGVLSVAAYRGCGIGKYISDTIHVFPVPNSTYGSTMTEYCLDDGPVLLSGGSPSGGIYSGPGITNNVFDPFITGAGVFPVIYYYENAGGCFNSDTGEIIVHPIPNVTLDASDHLVCSSDGLIPLLISPLGPGGTLFGLGLSGTNFDPSGQIPGIYLFTYWYNDSLTCFNSDTTTITVISGDAITFNVTTDTVCSDSGFLTLNATPSSGTFSGTGVMGNQFNTNGLPSGAYVISYEYQNSFGCVTYADDTIFINNCLSISELNQNDLQISPNPASNQVFFTSKLPIIFCELFSSTNEKIKDCITENESINIEDILSGMYFLRFTLQNNQIVIKKLIVIK